MTRVPRFVLSLVPLGLVVTACGSSEATERPTITPTPTTSFVPVTELPVTEPPVTEPSVTQPAVTQPPATESAVTEPPVTEPVVTEPTDPVPTEPAVTEPAVTEPAVTEPAVTETADPFAELARIEFVADGYSEADAECLASNLDFTNPLVLELDPEAIAPAFETCGVVPLPPS